MQVPDAEHDRHDTLLVAGLLDRSTDAPERRRGEMLVAGCAECAALHQDLLDLRSATRTLATPTRTRDYSLTPDDARRLRRTGWRRLVAIFGSTRDAFSRPLAIGLTTIGLVGLLVTTIPGALPGGWSTAAPSLGGAAGAGGSGATSQSLETTKAAPLPSAAPSAPGPAAAALTAPSPAPTGAAAPPAPSVAPVPSGEAFDTFIGSPEPSVGAAGIAPGPEASAPSLGAQRNGAPPDAGPTVPVDHLAAVALAGLFFAAGLGLFALRWAARRV